MKLKLILLKNNVIVHCNKELEWTIQLLGLCEKESFLLAAKINILKDCKLTCHGCTYFISNSLIIKTRLVLISVSNTLVPITTKLKSMVLTNNIDIALLIPSQVLTPCFLSSEATLLPFVIKNFIVINYYRIR